MSQYVPSNSLFAGTYQTPTEPYWAREASGGAIGTDIQVSTIQTNAAGYVVLDAEGTVGSMTSAFLEFNRTSDVVDPTPSLISMMPNIPLGGGVPTENISIVNNTKTYYDPLAVGDLVVYGINNTVTNPVGAIGVITQYNTTTDMAIETTGLHVSALFISSINGDTFPGGNLGPDAQFSTVNINEQGFVRFNAAGTSNAFLGGALFFQKSPDIPQTYSQAIKMAPNNLGNILPVQTVENISITHVDDVKVPPGIYYDNLALGDLYVFGTNNIKSSALGQVAVFQQFSTTTDVECVTTGFHTENLIVSSINGQAPNGGGGSGVNLTVSTIQVNPTGSISMRASGTLGSPETAEIQFFPIPGAPGGNTTTLAMNVTNTVSASGVPASNQNVAFTKTTGIPLTTTYDEVAMGNLYIYGTANPLTSTIGQLAVLEQWSTTSTDLQIRTTGLHTSSIFVSTLVCPNLQVSGNVQFSSISVSSISTSEATVPLINASTISFEPSLGGVKFPLNLGIGEFLGAAAGTFAGETVTMTLATGALLTGLVGMIAPRTTNNIYPPGEVSTFQTINLQTQLQFSTLGSQVSSFYRFVSSSDGSMGTVTPGQEYIVSSIVPAGTLCIRSFSDPMNLANPSTFTSTVQSFGYWIPVPPQVSLPFSTVTGDFNVRSTLTAYRANISTTMNVQGAFQAGNITSIGQVAAGTGITTGGNVTAFGTGSFTSGLATGGLISGASLNVVGGGAYIEPFVSTTQVDAFDVNAQIADIGIGNITVVNTQNLNVANIIGNSAVISSFNVSSINGFPYTPGGSGGTLGVFSTVFVSSMTTTSSLTVTGGANVSSTFTNSISTNQLIALGIGAFSAQIGAGTPTLYNNQGIYNPVGQIDYGIGNISSISNNVLWNKTTSTQALFVSTVNGATYPPPFNSTIIGNFNVTSTLTAEQVFVTGDITTLDNIGAGGNITGFVGSFTQVNSSGQITGTNATIGGVVMSGGGVLSGTQITATNVNLTTINGAAYPPNTAFSTVNGNFNVRSTLTAYALNVSTNISAVGSVTAQNLTATQSVGVTNNITAGGTVSATFINASAQVTTDIVVANTRVQTPAIIGLTSINGAPYPAPLVSSFQTLNTSSITASTITTAGNATIFGAANVTGTVTAGSFSSAGNYNGLSATYPGVNISIAGSGNISAGNMTANGGTFISTSISSITTSTINGVAYPPPSGYNPNPSFSTVTVSSVVTTNGLASQSIVNNGTLTNYGSVNSVAAVIGGVNIPGGGVLSGIIISGTQGNFSGIVRTQAILNPAVGSVLSFGNNITGNFSTVTVDHNLTVRGLLTANTEILTPTLYTQNIFNPTSPFSTINVSGVLKGVPGVNDPVKVLGVLSGTIASNQYTNMTAGALVVAGISSGFGATTITGGSVDISRALPTDQALNVNGTVNLQNEVRAPSINTTINTTSPFRIGTANNALVVPLDALAGYGDAPFVIGKMLTSQYSFGVGVAFINGNPYRIPNLRLSPGYACYVKLIYQSRGNQSGNGQQMYGVFDIYVGLTDGVAGQLQPALRQNGIFVQNSSINIYYDPVSGIAEVGIISNVGSGGFGYVVDVSASWTVQPLFTYL